MTTADLYLRLGQLLDSGTVTGDITPFVRLSDGSYILVTSIDIAWDGVPPGKIADKGILEFSK